MAAAQHLLENLLSVLAWRKVKRLGDCAIEVGQIGGIGVGDAKAVEDVLAGAFQ